MNTVEKIKLLCKDKGIAISRMERDLGFGNGYISQLRKGSLPADRLIKVSEYFKVPTDWLLYDNDTAIPENPTSGDPLFGTWQGHEHSDEYMPLSSHEKLLLDTWRSVDKVGQERLLKAFMAVYNEEIFRMRGISFEDS